MKSCRAMVRAAVARPRIVGVSLRSAEDDQQNEHHADNLNRQLENAAQRLSLPAIERRMGHQLPHQRVAEHHADQDEEDQREGAKNQMQHDAVLQEHLRGPFAVDRRELLLGLNAIVVDAEDLALGASIFQSRASLELVCRTVCRTWPLGIGLGFERIVRGGQGGDILLRFLLRLLDRAVPIALTEPGADAACKRAVLPCRHDSRPGPFPAARLSYCFIGCFVRGQFVLDLRAVIAGGTLEIVLRIGEFVGVEAELGLGDFEVVSSRPGRRGFRGTGGRLQCSSDALHLRLILHDELLELLRSFARAPGHRR